ncbi:MAG: cupin domain-containing protein [Parvularculaceae bacterium]|nr:cupin domain-containing protein [Parvularculaceae bacterium]
MRMLFMSAALSAAILLSGPAVAMEGAATAKDAAQETGPIPGALSALPRERLSPDIVRQALHGENITLSRWEVKAGAKVPMHSHANEQISLILSGRAEATSGGKKYVLGPGDFLLFPPYVEHEFVMLEDAVALDLFAPRRDDWIDAAAPQKAASASNEADAAALVALQDAWVAAEISGDAAALARITDPRMLSMFSSGKMIGRDAYIDWIVNAEIAPFTIIAEEIIIDGDTAVVVSQIGDRTRLVWTAIKRGGEWRGLAQTFSTIEPEK